MPKPLSNDLRRRIVEAREAGGSLRSVRDRFGVAASSVSNLHTLWREGERRAEEDGGRSPQPCDRGAPRLAPGAGRRDAGSDPGGNPSCAERAKRGLWERNVVAVLRASSHQLQKKVHAA